MHSEIVLFVLAVICFAHVANAQGFGRKKEIIPAIRTDIKYIECQFCQAAAKHLHHSIDNLRQDAPSWKPVTESDIQEHLELACNADKDEGEWLLKFDVQEHGAELVLKEMSKVRHTRDWDQGVCTQRAYGMPAATDIYMITREEPVYIGDSFVISGGVHMLASTPRLTKLFQSGCVVQPGKCKRECHTMIRMCEDIVGDHDTDLAELLLSKPGRAKVEQELCHNLSSVCSRKPPKFSGPRPDGEDFEEVDLEELQMQRMMAMMQDQGMSGNLVDRATAMEQMDEYQKEMEEQGLSMGDISSMAGGLGGGEL